MFNSMRLLFAPDSTAVATPPAAVPVAAPVPWTAPVAAAPVPAVPVTTTPSPATPAPVEYKFKLPDGSFMQPADVERFTAFAKERNLTPEQAQAIIERDHKERESFQTSAIAQMAEQDKSWLAEVKADSKIGGQKWTETEANVNRAFQLGDPDGSWRKELAQAHLSYHPGLVRFLNTIGAARKEDSLTAPVTQAPEKDTRSPKERLEAEFKKSGQK